MAISDNISIFIEKQFPERFREDGAQLVAFIKHYYAWLETTGQVVDASRKLQTYKDVETSPDSFFIFLRDQFMQNIPQDLAVDERLLVRHIVNFYKSKGSEKSIRLLFRILYNEEVEFYYPGKDILRASDGRWTIEKSLQLRAIQVDPSVTANEQVYTSIVGETSGARCQFVYYQERFSSGVLIREIFVTNIHGTFVQGENIKSVVDGSVLAIVESDGIVTYPGRYVGSYGFLSWDKYLEDNEFYQEFSYVIRSSKTVNSYREPLKKLAHPAGTKLFGSILVNPEIDFFVANSFVVTIGQSGNSTVIFTSIVDPISPLSYTLVDGYLDTEILDYNAIYRWFLEIEDDVDLAPANNTLYYRIPGDGWISTSNVVTLNSYVNYSLKELQYVPMGLTGTDKLLIGTDTHFRMQVSPMSPIIPLDTINQTNNTIMVSRVYSNTFARSAWDYPHDNLFKQRYLSSGNTLSSNNSSNTAGLGLVHVKASNTIISWATYPLGYLAQVPLFAVGKRFLVEGTGGANFDVERALANNRIMIADDNGYANTVYSIRTFYSNNFIRIDGNYFFPNTTNSIYRIYDLKGDMLNFSSNAYSGWIPSIL